MSGEKKKSYSVLRNFTDLCWAAFKALLGCVQPTCHNLDKLSLDDLSSAESGVTFNGFFDVSSQNKKKITLVLACRYICMYVKSSFLFRKFSKTVCFLEFFTWVDSHNISTRFYKLVNCYIVIRLFVYVSSFPYTYQGIVSSDWCVSSFIHSISPPGSYGNWDHIYSWIRRLAS